MRQSVVPTDHRMFRTTEIDRGSYAENLLGWNTYDTPNCQNKPQIHAASHVVIAGMTFRIRRKQTLPVVSQWWNLPEDRVYFAIRDSALQKNTAGLSILTIGKNQSNQSKYLAFSRIQVAHAPRHRVNVFNREQFCIYQGTSVIRRTAASALDNNSGTRINNLHYM